MALRDIIGQDRSINILLKTIQRGRLPSSYLFAGESGIGKKLAAINLAKVINCLNASNRDAKALMHVTNVLHAERSTPEFTLIFSLFPLKVV